MIPGFPYQTFPTGWFQVAWSAELEPGVPRPLHFFDEELVAYRGESGEVHVMEGHCRHLGAHLGVGSMVEGDNIRCPFHGWCYAPNGRNIDIPYSRRKKMNIAQRVYPTCERDGLVLVWYDADGGEPTWDPPSLLEEHGAGNKFFDIYPQSVNTDKLRMQPLMMVENGVDFAHLVWTHRWVGDSKLEKYEVDGHRFMGQVSGNIVTPKGEQHTVVTEYIYGQGLIAGIMEGMRYVVNLACVTPIDHEYSQVHLSTMVSCPDGVDPRQLDGLGKAIVAAQREEVMGKNGLGDRKIWENQKYIATPPMPPEEHEGVRTVREWSAQFYPDAAREYADA